MGPMGDIGELSRALFESSADAILVVDSKGNIAVANGACWRLLGYEPAELRGRPVELLVPERFPRHGDLRAGFQKEPRPRPMGLGLSLCARHADGREIPVDISLTPLQLGERIWSAAVLRDLRGRADGPDALRSLATPPTSSSGSTLGCSSQGSTARVSTPRSGVR